MMLKLPNSVQVDDMIQAGMIGLLDAARAPTMSCAVGSSRPMPRTYTRLLLDELRGSDWLPRSMRSDMRPYRECDQPRPAAAGQGTAESDIAKELGITLQEYQQMPAGIAWASTHVLRGIFHNADDEIFLTGLKPMQIQSA